MATDRRSTIIRRAALMLGPATAVAAWQVVHALGLLNPTLLPGPVQTIKALWRLLADGGVLTDVAATLLWMGAGYCLAVLVGVLVGLAMGVVRPLYYALGWLIDAARSTPVTALYPLFVLVLGIGSLSKIAMVFAASVTVIALNSAYGVLNASPVRAQMARLHGASGFQVLRWITFYDALGQTLVGLRVALSYSLLAEVLSEMFMGSQFGMGQRITEAYTMYASDDLCALIILTGALGYTLNVLFVLVERRVVPWGASR